nr:MAG TPA: hypothetical protein [Caudoviricetes sp.]
MVEYIEREAAIDAIMKVYVRTSGYKARERVFEAEEAVHRLPVADVAPVVRCKDCKHFNFEHMECENEAVSTDHEGGASYSLNFYLDDFCSYGQRKEETND